jgi:hypothetical protein
MTSQNKKAFDKFLKRDGLKKQEFFDQIIEAYLSGLII